MKPFALTAVTGILYCTVLSAAPADQHIRGRIVSIAPDTLVIRTSAGTDISVALNDGTHYLQVAPSSLDKIESGSYIGTATKDVGSTQIALEVMIFPAAMRGLNAGHFPYDRLPDTTLAGAPTTASMMTNGNVSAVRAPSPTSVSTTMTNGAVSASASNGGVRYLTVTYNGGQQSVLVPPTAPIVKLLPETKAGLSIGAYVFVDAAQNGGGSLTAGLVAAGVGGLKVPF
jgi:hypothetical protein